MTAWDMEVVALLRGSHREGWGEWGVGTVLRRWRHGARQGSPVRHAVPLAAAVPGCENSVWPWCCSTEMQEMKAASKTVLHDLPVHGPRRHATSSHCSASPAVLAVILG
ncbi:hypothetical protein BS78_05G166300 [Paspalum vaginatum]|nr:hypothetical protein BS78_05G166300 [Paspalum vaginatum]